MVSIRVNGGRNPIREAEDYKIIDSGIGGAVAKERVLSSLTRRSTSIRSYSACFVVKKVLLNSRCY